MIQHLRRNPLSLCFVCIIVILTILYKDYLLTDPVLLRDDPLMIAPISKVSSLSEYVRAVRENSIPDVQPLRDLTFWMNVRIQALTGVKTYHLFNFFLFIASLFTFSRILRLLGWGTNQIILSLCVFAFHPIMLSSVGWISARKHDLGLLLIFLSIYYLLKDKMLSLRAAAFFVLSLLCHQIFSVYFVFAIAYVRLKGFQRNRAGLSFAGLGLGLIFSLGVYKTFYQQMGTTSYLTSSLFESFSRYVLSLGRSITLLFFPTTISASYSQGSALNFVGLPILVLLFVVFWKGKRGREVFIWLLLAFLIHAITAFTFVHDTYLYLPLACFIIALNHFCMNNPLVMKPSHWLGLTFIPFLLLVKTIDAKDMWLSDKNLWKYSYEQEGSGYASFLYGRHLMSEDPVKGLQHIHWGAKNLDFHSHAELLVSFLHTVFLAPISIDQKLHILEDCAFDHEVYRAFYGLTLVHGTPEQTERGISILKPILRQRFEVDSEGYQVVESVKHLCKNTPAKAPVCVALGINLNQDQP